jgi:hypothetical protein
MNRDHGLIPARVRFFSVIESIWALGSNQSPILRGEADHSPPSSAKVKNVWSCTSTPPYLLMGGDALSIEMALPLLHIFEFKKKFQDQQFSGSDNGP